MAEDRLSHVKQIAALFLEKGDHELGVVAGVGFLVADHEAEPFSAPETIGEVLDVLLEIGDGNAFLVEVDTLSAARDAGHEGEISAIPAHHLDNKATPRGHCRLFDFVHSFDNGIQSGV